MRTKVGGMVSKLCCGRFFAVVLLLFCCCIGGNSYALGLEANLDSDLNIENHDNESSDFEDGTLKEETDLESDESNQNSEKHDYAIGQDSEKKNKTTESDNIYDLDSSLSPTLEESETNKTQDQDLSTGLIQTSDGLRYQNEDGTYAKQEFKEVNGNTYYFDSDGYAVYGLNVIEGERYYFASDGSMTTGWMSWKADGTRSYFDPENGGAALSGWQTIDNKTYYFDPSNCRCAVGVRIIEGEAFEFDIEGVLLG